MTDEKQHPNDDQTSTKRKRREQYGITPDFLEGVYRVREWIMQESKGQLFEDSAEMVRRQREERTEYLEQVVTDEASMIQQRRPASRSMLDELLELQKQILQDRNGQPFGNSVELIRQMREERTRQLMGESEEGQ